MGCLDDEGHANWIKGRECKMARAVQTRRALNALLESLLQAESVQQDLERERGIVVLFFTLGFHSDPVRQI